MRRNKESQVTSYCVIKKSDSDKPFLFSNAPQYSKQERSSPDASNYSSSKLTLKIEFRFIPDWASSNNEKAMKSEMSPLTLKKI